MALMQYAWILLLAVILDILIVFVLPRYQLLRQDKKNVQVTRLSLFIQAMRFEFIKIDWKKTRDLFSLKKRRVNWGVILELTLLALWALWVGRVYLDFDVNIVPAGHEFGSTIQSHHLWTRFQDCGWCVVWNGNINGGYPAFADVFGSALHPIVAVTTLVWGVVNGIKVAIIFSLWIAGFSQWWLARVLKLGWLPRLWSAALVIVGGHLAGRMQLGAFGMLFSTAMCSLVFSGVIYLARNGGYRAVVVLAVVSASAILSGQGYMQIGLVGILPAMFFLIFDKERRYFFLLKRYSIALGLALLLSAPFWIPVLHFNANIQKYTDTLFKSVQSISYLPLNFVIDDVSFYRSEVFGKWPYPYLYTLYIGWVPIVLAFVALVAGKSKDRRLLWFMSAGVFIEILLGSREFWLWAAKLFPVLGGIRHPSQIAGLAIPLILGLSAYGLEQLLNRDWPTIKIFYFLKKRLSFKWILLIPLLLSLQGAYQFTKPWMLVYEQDNSSLFLLLEELRTEDLQWVETPFGEHFYVDPALRVNLKLSTVAMPWMWKNRSAPLPRLEADRSVPSSEECEEIALVDIVPVYINRSEYYASTNGAVPCVASGSGGQIIVSCTTYSAGQLVVKENMWVGWKAWVDGEPTPLLGEQWLEVSAPPGEHIFEFRYLPWDVPLGLFLSGVGVFLCIWIWLHYPDEIGSLKEDAPLSASEEKV